MRFPKPLMFLSIATTLFGSAFLSTPAAAAAAPTARFDCASWAAGYAAGYCAARGQKVVAYGYPACSKTQLVPLEIEVICG